MSGTAYQREWVNNNREKVRAYQRAWRARNRDKNAATQKRYRAANPDKVLGFKMKRYGITAEEYARLLAAQGGVCAICRGVCQKWGRLSVDHRHADGKVRGLLCDACNVAIGSMTEDPARLRAAAEYLEKHHAPDG